MNGKQLKNSILQWAIQGKLVPQDPNDEPASVLLERIREEKARLVKEKKIKKDKNESIIFRGDDNSHYEKFADGTVKCIDDEIPFEIPQSWCWVRLNELGFYRKGPFGSSLTKDMFVPYSKSAIKVYEQKNAIQKDYRLGHYYISDTKFNQMQSFVTNPGDIIVSCAGTIGETYQLPDDAPIGIINQALMRVCLYDKSISDYWQMSFDYILLVNSEMKGAGSAIKNIPPFDVLKSLLVPIPPIAEQNRILSQYRILQSKIRAFETLNSDLERLNSTIFKKLKKSVLQEAIQGKLVPQDPNDEPASVLLERIKEEKAKLFKECKLKKKDLVDSVIFKGDDNKYYETIDGVTECIDEEIPYDLPSNWAWTRLGNVAKMTIGKTPARGDQRYWSNGEYSWVSISDMKDLGVISATKERISAIAVKELMGNISPKGSLLMSFKLTVGRTSLLDIDAYHNEAIITIQPFIDEQHSLRDYLFRTLPLLSTSGDSKDAIKGKTLNSQSLSKLLIPLAPLNEQKRITKELLKFDDVCR